MANNLLIIDPQCDFIDAPYYGSSFGRLPVVGAIKDIPRISSLITNHIDEIDKIFVSLDTHTVFHIGHRFWKEIKDDGSEGGIAPPGTTFGVKDNVILGSDGKKYEVNVKKEDRIAMNAYAISYLNKVINEGAKDGRNLPCTWSVHCIQGTNGWKIHPDLQKVLDENYDKVEYHIKGQNQLAEMYSIMKAEIPYETVIETLTPEQQSVVKKYVYNPTQGDKPDYSEYIIPSDVEAVVLDSNLGKVNLNEVTQTGTDKCDLKTTFNDSLFDSLTTNGNSIWVCGEALSHCVQFSTRDIVKKISEKKMPNKVFLIQNASSYVNLDAIGLKFLTNVFKDSSNFFIEEMKCSSLEDDAITGTMEIIMTENGTPLRQVPCVKKTKKSLAMYLKGRETANANSLKGGLKTKRRQNKSKRSRKNKINKRKSRR